MPPTRLTYLGIANDIADRIRSGEYAARSQLPSITQLTEIYSVSRATVVRAVGLLRDRGLVIGEPGRGIFVTGGPEV